MKCYNGNEFRTIKTTHGGGYGRCKWCHGSGCIACPGEVVKDAQRAIEPLFRADIENEDDLRLLKEYFGASAIQHAFGPDGDGINEIKYNAALATVLQEMRRCKHEPQP